MQNKVKVNGVWVDVDPSVKVNGAWQGVSESYTKVGGVWTPVYKRFPDVTTSGFTVTTDETYVYYTTDVNTTTSRTSASIQLSQHSGDPIQFDYLMVGGGAAGASYARGVTFGGSYWYSRQCCDYWGNYYNYQFDSLWIGRPVNLGGGAGGVITGSSSFTPNTSYDFLIGASQAKPALVLNVIGRGNSATRNGWSPAATTSEQDTTCSALGLTAYRGASPNTSNTNAGANFSGRIDDTSSQSVSYSNQTDSSESRTASTSSSGPNINGSLYPLGSSTDDRGTLLDCRGRSPWPFTRLGMENGPAYMTGNGYGQDGVAGQTAGTFLSCEITATPSLAVTGVTNTVEFFTSTQTVDGANYQALGLEVAYGGGQFKSGSTDNSAIAGSGGPIVSNSNSLQSVGGIVRIRVLRSALGI